MKKLLTTAFAFAAFATLVSSTNAQTPNRGNQRSQNHQTDNRAIRTYTETKIVRDGRQQFRETYEIKVFRNGKTQSKLISRVKINNDRDNRNNGKTSFETITVRKGRATYRETYQITAYRNGRVERKLIKSVRI